LSDVLERSKNALDAAGKSMCIPYDKLESSPGETAKQFDNTRWYCWSTCDPSEEASLKKNPLACADQYSYWPPNFCKKGTKNCQGPYVKRFSWKENKDYNKVEPAVGANVPYFRIDEDFEIGYNWSEAKKFESFMLQYQAYGYVEYYYNDTNCYSMLLLPGT